jgi:hypothetical protein
MGPARRHASASPICCARSSSRPTKSPSARAFPSARSPSTCAIWSTACIADPSACARQRRIASHAASFSKLGRNTVARAGAPNAKANAFLRPAFAFASWGAAPGRGLRLTATASGRAKRATSAQHAGRSPHRAAAGCVEPLDDSCRIAGVQGLPRRRARRCQDVAYPRRVRGMGKNAGLHARH